MTTSIGTLSEGGVLGAIRWAFDSAASRVLDDYSEDAGHDAVWLGVTRFTLFRDRLDRVFSCGRYAVPAGADERTSLDVVRAELTADEIANMPMIPARAVARDDLSGSPGWSTEGLRFLVASVPPGKSVNNFSWTQASPTKQRVAQQQTADSDLQTLFDCLVPEEQAELQTGEVSPTLDLRTLVVAHSLSVFSGKRELVLGRPRLNAGGGNAWHWTHDLLHVPPSHGGRLGPSVPGPTPPDVVPDAPVKLRRVGAEAGDKAVSK